MSSESYLVMTYCHGKAIAGYLHLPWREGDRAVRSHKAGPGLVVDYAQDGRPVGIEVTSPSTVSFCQIKELLASLHVEAVAEGDLAPLLAG